MKRFIWIFGFIFAVSSACSLPTTEQTLNTPTPRIQASATMEEIIIVIPTDTQAPLNPTATIPDYRATEIDAAATHDASEVSIAASKAEEAKAKAVSDSVVSTKEAENQKSSDEMNQLRGRIVSIQATVTHEAQEYAKAVPTISAAQTMVAYTAAREVSYLSMYWVIIVLVFILVVILGLSALPARRAKPVEDVEPQNIPQLTDPPFTPMRPDPPAHIFNVSSGTRYYPAVFQHELLKSIVSDEQIEWLANGLMRDGKRLRYEDWTPAWRNGFSDSKFSQLIRFLIGAGLAKYNNEANPRLGANAIEGSFVREFSRYRTDGPSGPRVEIAPSEEETPPPPTEPEPLPETDIQPMEE